MFRKKLLIPVITCAIALGCAFGAQADGWTKEGNDWFYYDANNNPVLNSWKKGADDMWRWLDSSGRMASNTWVDDAYYIDSTGIMVADNWKKLSDGEEEYWYYFGTNGKRYEDAWKKISDKWYYFDESGHMLTGWILDDMYYCDANGVMKTGWQKLEDPNHDDYNPGPTITGTDSEGAHWYYFQASGKKYVPESGNGEKRIDGKKYCFDEMGRMLTGWVDISDEVGGNGISSYRYLNSDGSIRTGWYSIEPPESLQNNYDNNVVWFYFTNTGVPKADADGILTVDDLVKIGGKTYLFNQHGTPVYGLQKVYTDKNSSNYYTYYFGTPENCCVQTGKISITESTGDKYTYYLASSGKGFTGVHDGYLYYQGKLQKADSYTKYTPITITEGSTHTNYLVNTSGKIEKNRTVKDADKVEYKLGASGQILKVDGVDVGSSKTFNSPEAPNFDK